LAVAQSVLAKSILPFRRGRAFWGAAAALSDDFRMLGYLIVGIVVLAWLISYVTYRINQYDKIEIKVYPSGCSGRLKRSIQAFRF
jgi:hypothetical protein